MTQPEIDPRCEHNYEGDSRANPQCCKCQQFKYPAEIDPRFIAEAEKLLSKCYFPNTCINGKHIKGCPVFYREAVARWGQEQYRAGQRDADTKWEKNLFPKG